VVTYGGINHLRGSYGGDSVIATRMRQAAAGGVSITLEEFISSLSPSFWLQADYDQNADYTDAAAVATGYDASANGLDVTQGTAGERPTYKTGILNTTLPVFRFDGGDSLLRGSVLGGTLMSASQGTIVAVMKQTGSQANNALFHFNNASILTALLSFSNRLYLDWGNQTSGQGRIFGDQPSGWDDTWHIVELHRAADNSGQIMVDGTLVVSGTFTANFNEANSADWYIGKLSTVFFLGDLYLFAMFKTALTNQQRTALRQLLSIRTGISTTVSLSLSSPSDYQVFQRSGSTGAINITGTVAGGGAHVIEASFNGGAYADIDTSDIDGAFSGTLSSQAQGQGTLTVRKKNNPDSATTVTYVGIGDIFVVAGQSNSTGQGTNNQSYSHATLKAAKYSRAGVWAELTDPTDSDGGGSVWPLIATSYLASQGVPCAFVP
jgi:hypothetical protein